MTTSFLHRAALLLALSAPGLAQSYAVLYEEGDVVAGVKPFRQLGVWFDPLAVNDQGDWLATIQLVAGKNKDSLLVKNGAALFREGDVLPNGDEILSPFEGWEAFYYLVLGDAGTPCFGVHLNGSEESHGLMLDTHLLLRTGDPFPSPDVPPGSTFESAYPRRLTSSGQLMALVWFVPPAGQKTCGLSVLDVDASGTITSIAVPYLCDTLPPGGDDPIEYFYTDSRMSAGGVLGWSARVDDDDVAYVDSTLIGREGEASPFPGWDWSWVTAPSVNASGSWLMVAGLQGGPSSWRQVLLRDGVVLYEPGDMLPAIAPDPLGFLWQHSQLTDGGEPIWAGRWEPVDARSGNGIFVGDELVVSEGETLVDGYVHQGFISTDSHHFAASDDGRFLLLRAELQGRGSLVLLDRSGPPNDACAGPDDALEDNDDAGSAVDVAPGWHNHLLVSKGDEDWYRVTPAAGQVLEIVANHSFESGDVDLELYTGDGVTLLASASKAEDDEWLVWPNASGAPLLVRAFVPAAATADCARYRLHLDSHGPDGCVGSGGPVDDAFEPNDDPASAALVGPGLHTGLVVHEFDKDYYRFFVPAGATLTLYLEYDDPTGNGVVWLVLRDQTGGPVLASQGAITVFDGYLQWSNTTGADASVDLETWLEPRWDPRPKCISYTLLAGVAGEIGVAYCDPESTSLGIPARMYMTGSDVVVDNDVRLEADRMPPAKFGYFLTSQTQGESWHPGNSQGILCLGGTIGRYAKQVQSTGANGTFGLDIDLTQMPPPTSIVVMPGETWSFQAWFRDAPSTSNFTNGVAVTFL